MIDHGQAYKLDLATNEVTPTDSVQSLDTRRIGYDRVNGVTVSTNFMGYDLRIDEEQSSHPLYFETYVMSDIPNLNGWIARYGSYVEARAGHDHFMLWLEQNALLVKRLRSAAKKVDETSLNLVASLDESYRRAGAFVL